MFNYLTNQKSTKKSTRITTRMHVQIGQRDVPIRNIPLYVTRSGFEPETPSLKVKCSTY